MLTNFLTSIVRTYVPVVIGVVATWLAVHFGVVLSDDTKQSAVALVTGLIAAAWYLLVRLLEQKIPAAGWLLGKPAKPSYDQLQEDGSDLVTGLEGDLGDFTSPDTLRVEGEDPDLNVPGASAPPMDTLANRPDASQTFTSGTTQTTTSGGSTTVVPTPAQESRTTG